MAQTMAPARVPARRTAPPAARRGGRQGETSPAARGGTAGPSGLAAQPGAEDGGLGQVRLTPRGRQVVIVVALVLAGLVGMAGGRATAAGGAPVEPTVTVTVAPGDTLWGFARQIARPGEDVRDVVLAIRELNGMTSAGLVAGDVLVLPAP
jgi:hypothetical protein